VPGRGAEQRTEELRVLAFGVVPYVTHRPAAPLSAFIDTLWWLSDTPSHQRERILPSGTQELVINLHEDAFTICAPVSPEQFSGAMVSGAYRSYFVIDTRAHASVMGVHFKPGCAAPILGLPPHELADRHVDLDVLWSSDARRLRERLCAAANVEARFRILEASLLARLNRSYRRHPAVPIALRCLIEGENSVGQLAAQLHMSRRRLIEIFSSEVGMTPKAFGRIQRFQRALTVARGKVPRLSALALEAGYCDQSHLTRDFVAFSGYSPLELVGRATLELKESHAVHAR